MNDMRKINNFFIEEGLEEFIEKKKKYFKLKEKDVIVYPYKNISDFLGSVSKKSSEVPIFEKLIADKKVTLRELQDGKKEKGLKIGKFLRKQGISDGTISKIVKEAKPWVLTIDPKTIITMGNSTDYTSCFNLQSGDYNTNVAICAGLLQTFVLCRWREVEGSTAMYSRYCGWLLKTREGSMLGILWGKTYNASYQEQELLTKRLFEMWKVRREFVKFKADKFVDSKSGFISWWDPFDRGDQCNIYILKTKKELPDFCTVEKAIRKIRNHKWIPKIFIPNIVDGISHHENRIFENEFCKYNAVCSICGEKIGGGCFSTPEGEICCSYCWEARYFNCNNCNGVFSLRDKITYGSSWYCKECAEKLLMRCGECGRFVGRYDYLKGKDGRKLCESCFYKLHFRCDVCGKSFVLMKRNYEAVFEGKKVCKICFQKNYFICSSCKNVFYKERREIYKGKYYCKKCVEKEILKEQNGGFFPLGIFDQLYFISREMHYKNGFRRGELNG